MADDDKLEPGDDPWAGLESTDLPDLSGDFAFAFEEQAPADAPATEPDEAVGLPDLFSAGADAHGVVEEIAAEMLADAGSETGVENQADEAADADDIDAWLGDPEPAPPLGDGEASGPNLSVFQAEEPEIDVAAVTESSADDEDDAANLLAGQSTVEIGTGLSGIPSPSTIGEFGDEFGSFGAAAGSADAAAASGVDATAAAAAPDAASDDMFAFAAAEDGPAEDDAAADPFAFASVGEDAGEPEFGEAESGEFDAAVPFAAATVAAAEANAAGGRPQPAKAAKQPAPRKKKPSMVGQLVGVVVGGAMSFPIVLAILWWGLGKDPLQMAPLVPDSLGFLVPSKFKPGASALAASGAGRAPSLDDILGAAGGDGAGPEPTDPVDADPVMEPEPDAPAVTDVVVDEPVAPVEPGSGDDDPLMALLKDDPAPVAVPEPPAPPPIPEPEPLDVAGLERTAARAAAALQAVVAVGDPTDPTFTALAVKWYRALAAHAEELALLERVAADTGRPLDTLPAAAADVHRGLVAHPELFESLARLTRDWLAFSKRGSDGVVAPATFLSARRVGPYWRAELQLGDKPLTVLSRAEPAVSPGSTVIVTGLAIDGDTVWASDLQAAEEASPFGL
jgi:hypothetical protein